MKKIFRYLEYIKEADEIIEEPDFSNFDDLKNEISEIIKNSIGTEGEKTFDDFIDDYIKNPDEVQIEGLINDSDIYEFYLKWRDDIDSLLSEINFYDELPSENKVFSLYDYVIRGTKRAITEVIELLKK
jgi:hypothetical protein